MFFCLVDVLSSTYLEIFLLFVTKKEKNLSELRRQKAGRTPMLGSNKHFKATVEFHFGNSQLLELQLLVNLLDIWFCNYLKNKLGCF
jgi:hypothetical protein